MSPTRTTNAIPNDFLTINSINKFCRCLSVGDSIAILGPIDPVLGAVDSRLLMRTVIKRQSKVSKCSIDGINIGIQTYINADMETKSMMKHERRIDGLKPTATCCWNSIFC